MRKIYRWHTFIVTTTALVFLALSYKLDLGKYVIGIPHPYEIIGLVLAIGGATIANTFSYLIFNIYGVRKWIMGCKHVEGHWEIHTVSEDKEKSSPLLNPGIAYMQFDVKSHEFCVKTTRLGADGISYETISEVAHIRTSGPDVRYLNFFKITAPIHISSFGFSSGKFICTNHFAKIPNRIEASMNAENQLETQRQYADRIPDTTVKKLYKESKNISVDEWMKVYLRNIIDTDSRYTYLKKNFKDISKINLSEEIIGLQKNKRVILNSEEKEA